MLLAELCEKEIRREKVESAIEVGRLALKVTSVFSLLLLSSSHFPPPLSSLHFSRSLSSNSSETCCSVLCSSFN